MKMHKRPLAGLCAACLLLLAGCQSTVSLAPIEDRSSAGPAPTPAAPVQGAEESAPGAAGVGEIPQTVDSAPVPARPSEAVAGLRTHVVERGDTVYNISMRYGVLPSDLIRVNGLGDDARISVGQPLRIPETSGMTAKTAPAVPAPEPVSSAEGQEVLFEPVKTAEAPQASEPAQEAPGPAAAGEAPALQWPLRGEILSAFADNGMGIDIQASEGQPVAAAMDGTVQYVGSNTKGYGLFVIVRHRARLSDSPMRLITVYGNTSKVLVRVNEEVRAGQVIALAGSSGADQPKLRFEVRQGTALNPQKFLPAQ